MAGIGFSLRKILSRDSLSRIVAGYAAAGVISGGPGIISVLGILVLSYLTTRLPEYGHSIPAFQTSFTYLIATSFVLTGFIGNSFSRYVADQIFLKRPTYILANLCGLLLLVNVIGGVLSFLCVLFLFPEQDILYRLIFMGCFVVLSNIWVVIELLSGLRDYSSILKSFFLGYGLIVCLSYFFRSYGLDAFLFSFLLGQVVLLFTLLLALFKEYPTNSIIEFNFLEKNGLFKIIIFSGFFFNLALWVDKFIFWFSPSTSYVVIGPLRASLFYDVPIFIAYLCSLPGLAVFFLLMETNFSNYFEHFNSSIQEKKSLSTIRDAGQKMISYAFNVISSIAKIQLLVIVIVFQFGSALLTALHTSILYFNVLSVAVIGTSLQVVLLAIITILYYLDKREKVLILSILFFGLNCILTTASIYLGLFFYGLGFTLSTAITCAYGMHLLNKEFEHIEYKMIMLARS